MKYRWIDRILDRDSSLSRDDNKRAPFNHYLIPSQPVFNVRFGHNGMLIATGEKTATAASVRTP